MELENNFIDKDWLYLRSTGEMGEKIRFFDWSGTTLGNKENWPQNLLASVSIMLEARIPMYIAWGKEFIQIYNDAFAPILGSKQNQQHLGKSTIESWAEIWPVIGPMFHEVMGGKAQGFQGFNLFLERNGFIEETYFDFSFSPIRNEDGSVGGVLLSCIETTERVIQERRWKSLALLSNDLPVSGYENEIITWSHQKLTGNQKDIPYSILYAYDIKTDSFRLQSYFGLHNDQFVPPDIFLVLDPDQKNLLISGSEVKVKASILFPESLQLTSNPWPETPDELLLFPLSTNIRNKPEMIMVFAKSSRLAMYNNYRDYFRLCCNYVLNILFLSKSREQKNRNAMLLMSSEKKFRGLIMDAYIPTAILKGPEFIIETANDSIIKVWGKDKSILDKKFEEAIPELKGQPYLDLLARVYSTGITYEGSESPVQLVISETLQTSYFNFVYRALRNDENDVYGILVMAYDVTPLVEARKKIEASENEFRQIADSMPQIVWTARPDGFLDYYNKQWYEYTGFDKNYGDQSWIPVLHPDDVQYCLDTWYNSVQTGREYRIEYRFFDRKTGGYRWFLGKALPVKDETEKIIKWFGSCTDINDQKLNEESVKLQAQVLENMNEGVSVSDENGFILFTNSAEDRMFGYDEGELTGKHVTIQNAYPTEENKHIVEKVITEITNVGSWSGEWHNIKKDGTKFFTNSHISSLQIGNRKLLVCVQRDITEEKRAEESLKYRKALLEAQNETIPDGILIVDAKGKMLSHNKRFEEIWNIPAEIIANNDDNAALEFAMTQLKDPQAFIDRVNYLYQNDHESSNEEVHFTDGRIIERFGKGVVDDEGTYYGWAWYFRDVTQRRVAEENIRESEEKRRLIMNAALDAIILMDTKGIITFWNPQATKIFGWKEEEVIGSMLSQSIIPERFRKMHDGGIETYLETGHGPALNVLLELSAINREQKEFPVELTVLPIKQGKEQFFCAFIRDITVTKMAQIALKDSEIKFRTLAESTPQMVWSCDNEGTINYMNSQMIQFIGAKKDGFLDWEDFTHFDDYEYTKEIWLNALDTGMPYEVEERFKRIDGIYRWHLTRAVPEKDELNNVLIWIGTCTDIHDQKIMAVELEKRVEDRTRELLHVNEELKRTNLELEQFAYVASHDLQEPLRKIQAFSDYVINNINNREFNATNYLQKINSAGFRMSALINDLLTFSRLSRIDEQFIDTDLNKILKNVENDFELLITQKKGIITSEKLPVIKSIPLQINQLFYNLIGNSLKFCDKEPRIDVKTRRLPKKEIKAHTSLIANHKYIELSFTDNGIGFEQSYEEKIFTIFQRLNNKQQFDGTGIGLAMCKKIIQNHNGEIRVNSIPGEGSTFYVLLPVSAEKIIHTLK